MCGETSDWLAAFDLNAINEDVFIEDIQLLANGNSTDFANAVKTVTIYASDLSTVLYGPVTVNSNVVSMNNINLLVDDAFNDTIYVKVQAELIGNNQPGIQSGPFSFSLSVTDAYGIVTGNQMPVITTGPSDDFYVVPVGIADISFVSSTGTVAVDSTLSTNANVAILKIVADNWSCTDSLGGDLDLHITQLAFNETLGTTGPTTVASYEIQKTTNVQDASPIYTASSAG